VDVKVIARRRFLRFMAESSFFSVFSGASNAFSEDFLDPDLRYILSQKKRVVSSAESAMDVFDLEAVARKNLPPAHYGYIATGVDGERTQIANRLAYEKVQLNMRRLIDEEPIDVGIRLFGSTWGSPLFMSPAGSQKAFDPLGELAVAKAARSRRALQILSTASTFPIEAVNEARGEPVWFQLYASKSWLFNEVLLKRVEDSGCKVLVVTVDRPTALSRQTQRAFMQQDSRDCAACHGPGTDPEKGIIRGHWPMLDGLDKEKMAASEKYPLDWKMIDRIRRQTKMAVVLKGIVTGADARLCLERGVDGIVVSNHGGRAEESGRGTIESLPEVVAAVKKKIPVLIDGGIRRGTDIFKALASGADAVGIGRPYLWGLAAFGQLGVERVLDILRAELMLTMRQAGTKSIDEITPAYIAR